MSFGSSESALKSFTSPQALSLTPSIFQNRSIQQFRKGELQETKKKAIEASKASVDDLDSPLVNSIGSMGATRSNFRIF